MRCILILLCFMAGAVEARDLGGSQFIGFSSLNSFQKEKTGGAISYLSPIVAAEIPWNELIVSWNADMPEKAGLKVEARVLQGGAPSPWYVMGLWSRGGGLPKESVRGQKEATARVETDTLILAHPGRELQVRLTASSESVQVRFVGLSVSDNRYPISTKSQAVQATKTLDVPERSQMAYAEGGAWCSPASTSMVLAYWGAMLRRPELIKTVPEVASGVYDRNWPGTGNWPFNTAYAGSFSGMRGYVTRFANVGEVREWVQKGFPVVASVAYGLLKGKQTQDGHLVVVVGFTGDGKVVVNDPGTRQNVRKEFPMENFLKAWAHSRNTVYLIYPERGGIPASDGHWEEGARLKARSGQRGASSTR